MSKLRPEKSACFFVIPDIHGMYNELKLILVRILPLRKSDGIHDKLIFLGDYIDRRTQVPEVIDLLLELQHDFPSQVIFLEGNHEMLLKRALDKNSTSDDYLLWMQNGGTETLIGYMNRAGMTNIDNPYSIPRNRIINFIPKEHLDFFNNLLPYYENDTHIFVHGGCDPFVPLSEQDIKTMLWDRSVYSVMKNAIRIIMPWRKKIIAGHNSQEDGQPLITNNFIMLDGSYADKLYLYEVNSGSLFSARKGKKRLVAET
jgi:serine/threonine protein phosphatase 1